MPVIVVRPRRVPRPCIAADAVTRERRAFLGGAVGLCVALVAPAARACEVQVSTLTVVHPWVRASGPDATTAIVCMTFKDVLEADRLVSARTPVAEQAYIATPTGAIEIPAGTVMHLTEESRELRLQGLRFPLQVGRQFPLTLEFETGGEVRTDLSVDFVFR